MAFAKRRYNMKDGKLERKPFNLQTEVLYQRLDGKWYAFTLVDDDLFYGLIPEDYLESKLCEKQKPKAKL